METTCRSCMAVDGKMRNVFHENIILEDSEEPLQICSALMACAAIKIMENDGLPQHLCISCELKLKTAYVFKTQCEKSDSFLRTQVIPPKIKQEPQEVFTTVSELDIESNSELNIIHDKEAEVSERVYFRCNYCNKVLHTEKDFQAHVKKHSNQNAMYTNDEVVIAVKEEPMDVQQEPEIEEVECNKEVVITVKEEPIDVQQEPEMEKLECNSLSLPQNITGGKLGEILTIKVQVIEDCENKIKKESFSSQNNRKATNYEDDDGFDSDTPLSFFSSSTKQSKESCRNGKSNSTERLGIRRKHVVSQEDAKLKCTMCEKSFDRPSNLARHMKIHKENGRNHMCLECGRIYTRQDNLKVHQKTHSAIKDSVKTYLCTYCGKNFNNSSNLLVHMRRHSGDNPFKCKYCGKGFPRSSDLKCHERIHSGEKPYLCSICGKAFNKSSKLVQHSRVHTGERPHKCKLCDSAFKQSSDLTMHMRRHNNTYPYVCGKCPARFLLPSHLRRHYKKTVHVADPEFVKVKSEQVRTEAAHEDYNEQERVEINSESPMIESETLALKGRTETETVETNTQKGEGKLEAKKTE